MEKFDVAVVGSGLAGITAAIRAAEAGSRTVVLEKMPYLGGTSALSVGAIAVCRSEVQKRSGIKDSPELFYKDIISCGENNIPELAMKIAADSASAFKFLTERGADFGEKLFAVDGHSVKRCFQPGGGLGKDVLEPLTEYFLSLKGAEIRRRTKVAGLIKNALGRVAGVRTLSRPGFPEPSSEKTGEISAEGGVIFASGGFERDAFFQNPALARYGSVPTSTHKGADAETLRMLVYEGALPYHTEFLRFGTSIAYNDIEKGMLADIKRGGRFISESASRKVLTEKIIEIAACKDWPILLFDKTGVENISNAEKFETSIAQGEVHPFPSLRAVSDFFSIPSGELEKNVKKYNEFVEKGEDMDFGKDFKTSAAEKIISPPFYACVVCPKLNYTQGGVLIDEKARAIGTDGNPIDGLFACGETAGGVHGKARLTCCSTLDCAVFGIEAGKNAAGR